MDCLQAQALISEALDREPVDTAQLEQAKLHCRTCPDCASFVSALAAIQRTPAPEPPEGLAGKIMDALAIELIHDRAQAARTEAEADAAGLVSSPSAAEPVRRLSLKERWADPRSRNAVLIWASAAAVVFVAAGFGAVAGVRQITAPREMASSGIGRASDSVAGIAPESDTLAAPEQAPQSGQQDKSTVVGQAPGFIAVNGAVYRLAAAVETTGQADLRRIGSTRTSLDPGGSATTAEVFALAGQTRVFVKRPSDGAYVAFDPVIRSFRGANYVLQSGEIGALGEWPTLPSSIPEPREDGSPTFTYVEDDPNGNAVYRLSNSTVERGIAIAPGTSTADPAAGNPNWTWWSPAR